MCMHRELYYAAVIIQCYNNNTHNHTHYITFFNFLNPSGIYLPRVKNNNNSNRNRNHNNNKYIHVTN